jgi:hypothetical protein
MVLESNGRLHFLSVAEHLQQKPAVFWNHEYLIRLSVDKNRPFFISPHHANNLYIDLFALRFGHKEPLQRRIGKGWLPIHYGCSRAVRDEILLLPEEEVLEAFTVHNCLHTECQYWSHPTGIRSKYAVNCLLARYMIMHNLDIKNGLTLEEVSQIFKCTRERIRQIEEKAMRRMRHQTRMTRFYDFQEYSSDSPTYFAFTVAEVA